MPSLKLKTIDEMEVERATLTVEQALSAFPKWMNRPLARVQVYSWHVARRLFNGEPDMLFRARSHYRDSDANEQRKLVAGVLRNCRKWKCVNLPYYVEGIGEYAYRD